MRIEFRKSDVEDILKKLAEKKYTNILHRTIDGVDYCAFTHTLIYGKSNLKYFEPFMKNRPNKCFICGINAKYNYKGLKVGKYCANHKLENMIDFYRNICQEKNCIVRASFGGTKGKPLFCKKHSNGAKDVISKVCEFKNCEIKASFGYEWQKQLRCKKHCEVGMIDVRHKRCSFENCIIRSSFGYEWQKPLRCYEHKDEKMEDVISFKCKYNNCKTRPIYGYEWQKPIRCFEHRIEKMINVKTKRCDYIGCNLQSSYGFNNEKLQYCSTHKLQGMVSKNKKCDYENCNILPSFGYEHRKPIRCFSHKEEKMKNVMTKKCNFKKCETTSSYGYEWRRPIRCFLHKEKEMENVVSKKCLTVMCDIIANKKYEGYCSRCFIFLFPNKSNARNFKTKEIAVVDFIKMKFSDLTWVYDKISGESKRRPDLLCKINEQIIIIEIDENAHSAQEYCSCENKRIMEISQDLNHKPIVFIRFNPDKYNDINKKKITGCWKINGNGICVINNENLWQIRLNVLSETINYWIENKTEKTIEQIFLYYDGFN